MSERASRGASSPILQSGFLVLNSGPQCVVIVVVVNVSRCCCFPSVFIIFLKRFSPFFFLIAQSQSHLSPPGGQGAWNMLFPPVVIREYGMANNTRNITSFACLLRIIRNVLQHPEHERSMRALTGNRRPSPDEILAAFLEKFPWLYPHALYYADRFREAGRPRLAADLFLTAYRDLENFACRQGMQLGSLAPLQDGSYLHFEYESIHGVRSERVRLLPQPVSCIALNSVRPAVEAFVTRCRQQMDNDDENDDALPLTDHLFRCAGEAMRNPFDGIDGQVFVPEGVTIQVLKPEVRLEFPQLRTTMKMPIRHTYNVKAIKGHVTEHVWPGAYFDVVVFWEERILGNEEKLADFDFVHGSFVVRNQAPP